MLNDLSRLQLLKIAGFENVLSFWIRWHSRFIAHGNYTEEDELRGLLLWRLGGA
jgi:hypothetical protein